ncbi:MAG: amidohydrolase family protein [Acidimicrobiales bacterium]
MTPTQQAAANAGVTPAENDLPNMISVDDHVMEPKNLWQEQLPASLRKRGPRTVREKVKLSFKGGHYGFERDVEDGAWCDVWVFDDLVMPTGLLHAPAGIPRDEQRNVPAVYEDFREGTWDQSARLSDMNLNHVDAAINYPNIFPRFAGQGFLERGDKELALHCLRIYNDWMIDDWCNGAGKGRLIPLTLVPLWDPALAAEEVRRCAAKGSYAIAFSENVAKLGQPSLYTGAWDVLWDACQETDTSVSMHIGSSSSMPTTSDDAPLATSMSMYAQNAQGSLCDWVFSGSLERFPDLTIAYAESQVGWMPFQLERMDAVWSDGRGDVENVKTLPSELVKGRVYGCVFDDLHGLINRDAVGIDHILWETDYPHSDGTFPHSRKIAHELFTAAGMNAEECRMVLRSNAVKAYGLDRFGVKP